MNILHKIATTIMFITLASNIFAAESTVPLNSGVSIQGIADRHDYQHYKIHAFAGDTVKVDLYGMDADGDLYVRIGSKAYASTSLSDCHSWKGRDDNGVAFDDSCSVTLNQDADVYIAVYAVHCINNVQHSIVATINPGQNQYGNIGSFTNIKKEGSDRGDYTVYYPAGIASRSPKPLIFMVAGGKDMTASRYQVLIKFMVSHGNTVLVSKGSINASDIIDRLEAGLNKLNIKPYVDTSKIGVVGHSTGGAHAFNVLKHFSDNDGYGSNGRFILSFDPYYIDSMSESDLQTLPSNTNIIIVQSTKDGLGSDEQTPKVALTIYSLLDSIPDQHKDYQVHDSDGHGYIVGNSFNSSNVANMRHVLKPLDALMDYTFNKKASAQNTALGVGSDRPISDGSVTILEASRYEFRCNKSLSASYRLKNYCNPKGL